jgi:uncharacterized membrane protein YphA (DoxX/SURF4 family)
VIAGGLLAGHGAQKLFGWFGGYGLQGTGGWLESLGLRPGSRWAALAGAGEFGGGVLTALGLLHPLGPMMMLGPMSIAVGKVHWGKPIWGTEGGAELPVTNMAVGLALAFTIPGAVLARQSARCPGAASVGGAGWRGGGRGHRNGTEHPTSAGPRQPAGRDRRRDELQGGEGASAG